MRRAILMLLLTMMSNNAIAEWVKFLGGKDFSIYVDLTTIRNEGSRVRIQTLADFVKPQNTSGGSFMSVVSQSEHDCKNDQERSLFGTYFSRNMGGGETISRQFVPGKWRSVPTKHAIWNIACVNLSNGVSKEWVGIHVDYLVATIGSPQRSIPLADGGRLLEYGSIQAIDDKDNDIPTSTSEKLQNELRNNNDAITKLNEQLLNQYNAIDSIQRDNSLVGGLQQSLILPDLLRGADQISAQRAQLVQANEQISRQLSLEKQMAMNSRKQRVRSCSKLFTISPQGGITDARCL